MTVLRGEGSGPMCCSFIALSKSRQEVMAQKIHQITTKKS